eukprot:TRINITY_DN3254_c7_g1_i1.p1 TRINITY_DN3254_c7_g1~~TRINITY_DN3254_c7_g1_i1.p1  ORF type:complete len:218 (+),score=42.71 TRINITY_DN3254_c7_g1_i1:59-655(+)
MGYATQNLKQAEPSAIKAFVRRDMERKWMMDTKKRLEKTRGKDLRGRTTGRMTAESIITALSSQSDQVEQATPGEKDNNLVTKSVADFLAIEKWASESSVLPPRGISHSRRYLDCEEEEDTGEYENNTLEQQQLANSIERLTQLLLEKKSKYSLQCEPAHSATAQKRPVAAKGAACKGKIKTKPKLKKKNPPSMSGLC